VGTNPVSWSSLAACVRAYGTRMTARRWQVLTVKGDRIIDIRGFGDRTEAAARAGVPA